MNPQTIPIIALKSAGLDPDSEESILGGLDDPRFHYLDLVQAFCRLAHIGTERSLPSIKKHVLHSRQGVQIGALNAIGALAGSVDQDLYIDCLNEPKFRYKWTAISMINQHCDERAASAVFERIKKMLSRKRSMDFHNPDNRTELIDALEYLVRIKSDKLQAVCQMLTKKVDMLDERERKWINTNLITA